MYRSVSIYVGGQLSGKISDSLRPREMVCFYHNSKLAVIAVIKCHFDNFT